MSKVITIGSRIIGDQHSTFFIADIAANHDGSLDRARELIARAAESGADAAKFQNFSAHSIVSDYGFRALGAQRSHQSQWKKSVFEVYQAASLPLDWTPELKSACERAGIEYFSAPYNFEAIDFLEPYVPAYKIGSGDIDWLEAIERIAQKGKPVFLATGAATIGDVQRAVEIILRHTQDLVLMQCNTNYTGSANNFRHIHLNVLKTYRTMYPDLVIGLSDHTPGYSVVLGAVALGARVIEKHFTDDPTREGPDHAFSLDPRTFREMVDRTRELESALGESVKTIAENERETVILQRRCLRAARNIRAGEIILREMIDVLRPATPGAILPPDIQRVVGTRTVRDIPRGKELRWTDLTD